MKMKNERKSINKDDPMPLYSQLQDVIIEKINNGVFKKNDKLPTEIELIEGYDLSRTTVRKAIDNLVNEGYLEKRRGVGTFISGKTHAWDLQKLRSFQEEFESKGHKNKTTMLSIQIVKANPELTAVFGEKEKHYYQLERLRYIDDIPSIVVTTYVPQSLASGLEKYNFSEVSLFNTLNKQYGVTIGFAKKEFRAVKVEQKDGELLEVERGSPIQLVKTVTYNLEEEPIEYSISRDRGDLSVYKVVLKYQAES